MGINTEHPILFNRRVMLAYLAGRKSQTRRFPLHQPIEQKDGSWKMGGHTFPDYEVMIQVEPQIRSLSRYGIVGEWLYVRETFTIKGRKKEIIYQADLDSDQLQMMDIKWKPSIHMKKEQSRIMLPIIGKRFQRLQEIGAADALAEGITDDDLPAGITPEDRNRALIERFQISWDSIYKKPGLRWQDDPFVEAIEFIPYPKEEI